MFYHTLELVVRSGRSSRWTPTHYFLNGVLTLRVARADVAFWLRAKSPTAMLPEAW